MNLQTQRQRAANAIRDRILCWGDPLLPKAIAWWMVGRVPFWNSQQAQRGISPMWAGSQKLLGQNPPRRQMPSDRLGMRLQTGIILIPPQ